MARRVLADLKQNGLGAHNNAIPVWKDTYKLKDHNHVKPII